MSRAETSTNFSDKLNSPDSAIKRLAQEFHDVVVASRRFRWIGLGETTDELQRKRLVIYLDEDLDIPNRSQGIPIGEQFDNLSNAFAPDLIDLYILSPYDHNQTTPPERMLLGLNSRYGTSNHDPQAKILWEEAISLS